MELNLTAHARRRMQQRGVTESFLKKIFEHADVERPAGGNCRLYRVSRTRANLLGDEKLGRFAVIWADTGGQVVTVLSLTSGRSGPSYFRKH